MGYDDDECIVCYATGCGNNSCLRTYDDDYNCVSKRGKDVICAKCTETLFQSDEHLTHRVQKVLSKNLMISSDYLCFLCSGENKIAFELACCEEHEDMYIAN